MPWPYNSTKRPAPIGEKVELKTDHFDQDAADSQWVPNAGARGWIILSADKELKHNLIEIVASIKSGTHSFILTSGNLTGQEMAHAFITAMPEIKEIITRLTGRMHRIEARTLRCLYARRPNRVSGRGKRRGSRPSDTEAGTRGPKKRSRR